MLKTAGEKEKSRRTFTENCIFSKKSFLRLVCDKEFIDFLITGVISPGLEPGPEVQNKVLSLLQSWAHAFSHHPDLRGVAEVYMDLKKKGIQFPIPSDEDLLLVQSMQPSPTRSERSVSSSSSSQKVKEVISPKRVSQTLVSPGRLTEGQVKKVRRDIEITERHLEVFTELLAEAVPGQTHHEDESLMTEVSKTSQEMQARIMELVSLVQDRSITAQLLEINDKINNEMVRYERYLSKCKKLGDGKDPEVRARRDCEITKTCSWTCRPSLQTRCYCSSLLPPPGRSVNTQPTQPRRAKRRTSR